MRHDGAGAARQRPRAARRSLGVAIDATSRLAANAAIATAAPNSAPI